MTWPWAFVTVVAIVAVVCLAYLAFIWHDSWIEKQAEREYRKPRP